MRKSNNSKNRSKHSGKRFKSKHSQTRETGRGYGYTTRDAKLSDITSHRDLKKLKNLENLESE